MASHLSISFLSHNIRAWQADLQHLGCPDTHYHALCHSHQILHFEMTKSKKLLVRIRNVKKIEFVGHFHTFVWVNSSVFLCTPIEESSERSEFSYKANHFFLMVFKRRSSWHLTRWSSISSLFNLKSEKKKIQYLIFFYSKNKLMNLLLIGIVSDYNLPVVGCQHYYFLNLILRQWKADWSYGQSKKTSW